MPSGKPFRKGKAAEARAVMKQTGLPKPVRDARRGLALMLRESISDELIRDYYVAILMNRDPYWAIDDEGDYYITFNEGGCIVDPVRKDAAMRMLVERTHGLAAQHIQLDAEIRASVNSIGIGIATTSLHELTPQQLLTLEAALKPVAALTNGFQEVIDITDEQ